MRIRHTTWSGDHMVTIRGIMNFSINNKSLPRPGASTLKDGCAGRISGAIFRRGASGQIPEFLETEGPTRRAQEPIGTHGGTTQIGDPKRNGCPLLLQLPKR